MNLLEKLDALKARTGDSNLSLAKKAGVPPTTIYGLYQKGYENMKLSTLQAICDYFDVPLDYLAKDDKEAPAIADGLSEQETEFIRLFGRMTPQNQRLLLGIGELLLQSQETPPDSRG